MCKRYLCIFPCVPLCYLLQLCFDKNLQMLVIFVFGQSWFYFVSSMSQLSYQNFHVNSIVLLKICIFSKDCHICNRSLNFKSWTLTREDALSLLNHTSRDLMYFKSNWITGLVTSTISYITPRILCNETFLPLRTLQTRSRKAIWSANNSAFSTNSWYVTILSMKHM